MARRDRVKSEERREKRGCAMNLTLVVKSLKNTRVRSSASINPPELARVITPLKWCYDTFARVDGGLGLATSVVNS